MVCAVKCTDSARERCVCMCVCVCVCVCVCCVCVCVCVCVCALRCLLPIRLRFIHLQHTYSAQQRRQTGRRRRVRAVGVAAWRDFDVVATAEEPEGYHRGWTIRPKSSPEWPGSPLSSRTSTLPRPLRTWASLHPTVAPSTAGLSPEGYSERSR